LWYTILVERGIGGFVAALLIGGIAGLQPAIRAANLSPTEALHTT
jgi:putative ABC transport system permease protein